MAESARARTLVIRLWLPDRPGALGQVASRIGGVHGDVTAIDILERGGGRVVDELVVSLPAPASVDLLAKEIGAVDGVAVEHIRAVDDDRPDPGTSLLALAADVARTEPADRVAVFCDGLCLAADADWAVVMRDGDVVHRTGEPPDTGWLAAFIDGSEHLDAAGSPAAPGDVLWARLPRAGLVVAAGRAARTVHGRERARAALLASIADALIAPAVSSGPPPQPPPVSVGGPGA